MVECYQPKILLVASPNNPTGNTLTAEEMERLVEMVPEDTVILVDEAYAAFVSTDSSYIKSLTEKHDNIVICRTLSKFYGLPGLRMGFGFVGKGKEMERFCKYANMYLGYDRLSEELAIAALKSDAHYRQIAQVMQEARTMYETELARCLVSRSTRVEPTLCSSSILSCSRNVCRRLSPRKAIR